MSDGRYGRPSPLIGRASGELEPGLIGTLTRDREVTVRAGQSEKGAAFRALHEGETFIIPNPWDAGSAKMLAALGFKALASTSSGFAFTLGRRDGRVTLDEVAEHIRVLDGATEL